MREFTCLVTWTFRTFAFLCDLRDLKKGIDASFKNFSRSYGAEIEAANKANTELATDISVELIKAVKTGKINEKSLIHILQSQTNLAFGFRGLTKLQMISVLEGSYKDRLGFFTQGCTTDDIDWVSNYQNTNFLFFLVCISF